MSARPAGSPISEGKEPLKVKQNTIPTVPAAAGGVSGWGDDAGVRMLDVHSALSQHGSDVMMQRVLNLWTPRIQPTQSEMIL